MIESQSKVSEQLEKDAKKNKVKWQKEKMRHVVTKMFDFIK